MNIKNPTAFEPLNCIGPGQIHPRKVLETAGGGA